MGRYLCNPGKEWNLDIAYEYINFMLEPKDAAFFTKRETYGTASKDAVNFLDYEIKASFTRGLPSDKGV